MPAASVAIQGRLDDLGTPLLDVEFVVLDLETTGGSPANDRITEVGAVKIRGGEVLGTFHTLVNPEVSIPPLISALTGITDGMVAEAEPIEVVLPCLLEFLGGAVLVAHNASFDRRFVQANLERHGYQRIANRVVCTARLARKLLPRDEVPNVRLATLASYLGATVVPCHRALTDAQATVDVFHGLLERAGSYGVLALEDLIEFPSARAGASFKKVHLADRLPRCPGVYLFRDAAGRVLYVGKAKDLRTRVRSYFSGDGRVKIADLLRELAAIDHRPCATELEASVREVRLIQHHRPRYNRRGRNPERYCYLSRTSSRTAPRTSSGSIGKPHVPSGSSSSPATTSPNAARAPASPSPAASWSEASTPSSRTRRSRRCSSPRLTGSRGWGCATSGRCWMPSMPSGAGSSSTRATWTAPSRPAGPSSRSSPSRPVMRRTCCRGGSRPGVRAAASRASGPVDIPTDYLVVDGRLTLHPDEAPIVRRIVADFLDGKPARQIARALNEAEILAPAASKAAQMRAEGRKPSRGMSTWWTTSAVTRPLRNPVLVGWATHNGRIVLGPDGEPVNFGEGILAPGEHARVLVELERRTAIVQQSPTKTRAAGSRTGGGRPSRYLLVGTARCQGCSYAMSANSNNANDWRGHYYECGAAGAGGTCPASAYIQVEKADAEVMRQVRTRLAAMEPEDPVLGAIAERWRELTMPEGEGDRAVLRSRLDAVRGRIVDLEEARYVRGEFSTVDDVARWDGMMTRLRIQRDAVLQELEELGPPPDFDLTTLRATYSAEVWDATPLPQRRRWLQVAVTKVMIASSQRRKVPARDRVRVVLVGEETD